MTEHDNCVVTVREFGVLAQVMQWLESGQHPFKSVVLDSLTEIQKRCLDNITGVEAADQRAWGELLRKMEALVRRFRDLTMMPTNNLTSVVFICGTRVVDGVLRPHVQGQLATTLPYFVDVMGYLHVETGAEGGLERKLLVQPIGSIAAKDRTGRFGISIENPSITHMLTQLQETIVHG